MRNFKISDRLEEFIRRRECHLQDVIFKKFQFGFMTIKWQDVVNGPILANRYFFVWFPIFLLDISNVPIFCVTQYNKYLID